MATMYVANLNRQVNDFTYRLPEETKPKSIKIQIGQQVRLGDMSQDTIDRIVQQMARYGLRNVTELQQTRGYVGLLYSVGKPVPLDNERIVDGTVEQNDAVLNASAETRREATAAVVASQIQSEMAQRGVQVPRAEIEIVEETRGATPKLARGYEVVQPGMKSRHDAPLSERAKKRGAR
jgi:hypothetical protein